MVKCRSEGFTLLEIMIAMSIFAVMSVAMSSATQRNAQYAAKLEEKSIGHWIGMNKMTALQAQPVWPKMGKEEEEVEMSQREWVVVTEVKPAPAAKAFRQIEVKVLLKNDAFGGEDRQVSRLQSIMTNSLDGLN